MSLTLGPSTRLAVAALALGVGMQTVAANAAENHEMRREPPGYTQPERPSGLEHRPQTFDKARLNHNYGADRTFHIGRYHGPQGWKYHRYHYGEILPAMFWAPEFYLQDYWLFGLDIPPVGYEWVRFGPDAVLVNVANGQIVQVVYEIFL